MIIGILGGGQLARMLALAGIPLGYRFIFYDPTPDCCAATLGEHVEASYDDKEQLLAFARAVDVVTYEFENVPLEAAQYIAEHCDVHPKPEALKASQDRLREKTLFRRLSIPTPEFFDITSSKDLYEAAAKLGFPFVIKTRRGGYDGKGQYVAREVSELDGIWSDLAGRAAIAEEFMSFSREVSMVVARNGNGDVKYYDIAENTHREGILRLTLNRPDDPAAKQAQQYVHDLMRELDYRGVLALELFQIEDKLVANEFAPRVHNSGHWTIEGALTSQFENHIRAILNLPLGDTAHRMRCAMINFIGQLPDIDKILHVNDTHFHSYDKAPKPGRKIGHLTVRANDLDEVNALLGKDFVS